MPIGKATLTRAAPEEPSVSVSVAGTGSRPRRCVVVQSQQADSAQDLLLPTPGALVAPKDASGDPRPRTAERAPFTSHWSGAWGN